MFDGIISSNKDKRNKIFEDNKPEEFIIDLTFDEDDPEKNQLLITDDNKNKNQNQTKKPLSKKNEILLNINNNDIILQKNEQPRIICFSRRRKFPKRIGDLTGFIITFCFFIFFTILITICFGSAKKMPKFSKSNEKLYNWILFFIWITSIISIICLIDAASADPGRQRGTPIPIKKFSKAKIRKILGGEKYTLKYCSTCHLIRDIRTFHCSLCGLCIEKHDHHCNYLSNCVGVYNYRKFFTFLIFACMHVSIIFFSCFHFIISQGDKNEGYEWIAFLLTIIIIFAGFFEIFTVWMLFQQINTIIQNRTTREFIKNKEYGIYNKGCKENCKEALCSNSIKEL